MLLETLASIFSGAGGGLLQYEDIKQRMREQAANEKLRKLQIEKEEFYNKNIMPALAKEHESRADYYSMGGRAGRTTSSAGDKNAYERGVAESASVIAQRILESGDEPTLKNLSKNREKWFAGVEPGHWAPAIKYLKSAGFLVDEEKPRSDSSDRRALGNLNVKGADIGAEYSSSLEGLEDVKGAIATNPMHYELIKGKKGVPDSFRFNPSGKPTEGRAWAGPITPEMRAVGHKELRSMPAFIAKLAELNKAKERARAIAPILSEQGAEEGFNAIQQAESKYRGVREAAEAKRTDAKLKEIGKHYAQYEDVAKGISTNRQFLLLGKEQKDAIVAEIKKFKSYKYGDPKRGIPKAKEYQGRMLNLDKLLAQLGL
jgi:hypothetical protein